MKVIPLRDRVVIKKDELEEKISNSMLFMPETVDRKQQTGTVIAVGPGQMSAYGTLIPTVVKPGDKVYFPKHSGVDLAPIEKGLFILPESEILAVLQEAPVRSSCCSH